jgi:hypothetical protein
VVREQRLSPNPNVVSRRLDDEVVLVHLHTNRIFALNETGARFWELLQSGLDRTEIERELRGEFEVDASTLAREVDALLRALVDEDLVVYDAS